MYIVELGVGGLSWIEQKIFSTPNRPVTQSKLKRHSFWWSWWHISPSSTGFGHTWLFLPNLVLPIVAAKSGIPPEPLSQFYLRDSPLDGDAHILLDSDTLHEDVSNYSTCLRTSEEDVRRTWLPAISYQWSSTELKDYYPLGTAPRPIAITTAWVSLDMLFRYLKTWPLPRRIANNLNLNK